jgi:cytochrome b involved in lipid metabolism
MAELKKISISEVRKHSTEKDCWVVIEGKVYNVTEYLPAHPGGPQWILDWAGKDATEAFATKGGMGIEHTETAREEMKKYLIGELASE